MTTVGKIRSHLHEVVLSGFGSKTSPASKFIRELYNGWQESTREEYEDGAVAANGNVYVELATRNDTTVALNCIMTLTHKLRGTGLAGKVMRDIVSKADADGITVSLYACNFLKNPDFKLYKLVAWYKKLGFVVTDERSRGVDMVRTPARPPQEVIKLRGFR